MKEIYKSGLWALISIPITWFGIKMSFALAHGSLPFLIPLLMPGLIGLQLLSSENDPDWYQAIVGYTSQYIGYFIVIYLARMLVSKYKTHNKSPKPT